MRNIFAKYREIILGLLILILLAVSWLLYARTLKNDFQNEIISSLEEVSTQGENILEKEINAKLELLTEVSRRVSFYPAEDYEEAASMLAATAMENDFKRMGIISADGKTYTTDHVQMDLSDRPYYKKAMEGEKCVSDPLRDREGNEKIHVYAVPVYHEDQVTGVLFGTYNLNEMRKQLEVSSFEGRGYTYIVNTDGNCIVDSVNPYSYPDLQNIFDAIEEVDSQNSEAAAAMKADFDLRQEGCIRIENHGMKYMYYRPLPINNWYLLTVAPASVLDSKMNAVLGRTYLLGAFMVLIFAGILIYILKDQKRRKAELMHSLYTDEITGGYSFAKFQVEAEKKIRRAEVGSWSLISLDIDDFKFINELLGYEEGNHLIRYIHGVLGEWCGSEEIFAHQSADMFVALADSRDHDVLCRRLEELCSRLQSYSIWPQNKLAIVPALGIFQIRDKGLTLDFCLDCAGIARKSRKGQFAVHYAFYDERVKEQIYRDKRIEAEMKGALENGEFQAYYQPQYDAESRRIVGAEALVRWARPDSGLVPPGEFIPLFEKNGFISELDRYMFRQVCEQQKEWEERGYEVVPVSVNVSRKLLYDLNFVEKYNLILTETAVDVRNVEIEITESVFFDNQPRLLDAIRHLHQSGYRILLDDFGTGYSSMAMLNDMSFDTLKIDKSFVDNIGDERGNKIVDGIIRLADSLELSTIAEGVETREQYEYLKARGCDVIQGYYFGRPMTAESFGMLLSSQTAGR